MPIHIQLSAESRAKLKAQKRNSTITALALAILLTALIGAILFFIALNPLFHNEEELVTYSPGSDTQEEVVTEPTENNEIKRKPSAPSSSMAKVIASASPSSTSIPVPLNDLVEPSIEFGDGNDFGNGWGSSEGNGIGETSG